MEHCKVVVIRFHCLYTCIHSKITENIWKKKYFRIKKYLKTNRKTNVIITETTSIHHICVCVSSQSSRHWNTQKSSVTIKIYLMFVEKISVHKILYVILECYLRNYISSDELFLLLLLLNFNLMRNFEDEKQDI